MAFKKIALTLFITILINDAFSQNVKTISIKEAITIAKEKSLDYNIAVNTLQSSYWNYQSFKTSFLPKLSLSGTLPDYYRSINTITLPNGQNDFVSQNVANSNLGLNLSENIGLTGGSISVGSSLRRIDNFGGEKRVAYTSIPFTLSYSQNNLLYNPYKWQKKIEPLKMKEAKKAYVENIENISYTTVGKYFQLLEAKLGLALDNQNVKNNDTLLKITKARFEIGTAQLANVLQSEISLLNAKKSVSQSVLAVQTARQDFVRYLNLDPKLNFDLELPDSVIFFDIDVDAALRSAANNRKYVIEFQRRRLETEQEIERVKSLSGPSVNLRANIGLTQTGSTLTRSYDDLLRNQSVTVGFSIPLLDWGVNKSNRKRAEANSALQKNSMEQEQLSAEQEIYYQLMKWGMQKEQNKIAIETKDLANKRYHISLQKYSSGSMSYTDFNDAQLEKDRAELDYIASIRNYWSLLHLIRRLTLYDFINNKPIEEDVNFLDTP